VTEPLVLHLPPHLARAWNLARLIADDGRWSWADGRRLLERFDVSGPEKAFVLEVFQRHANLRVFRCNQRRFCGDVVLVDMSAPEPARRRTYVVELKAGEPLAIGGKRVQWASHGGALAELAGAGVITAASPVELVQGDPAVVLDHLR
jgi:hypothetical protein